MRKNIILLFLILFAGFAIATNNTIDVYEKLIAGQLTKVIGSDITFCFGSDVATDPDCVNGLALHLAPLFSVVFVLMFILLWSASSGIAWDGILMLLIITVTFLGTQGTGGIWGATAYSIIGFLFMLSGLAFLYRFVLRR